MKILAIRFARLGDLILLLPSLRLLKSCFPDCHLTLVTGHRCAPLAEMCPAIDDIISVDRLAMRDGSMFRAFRDMAGLVRDVRRRRFDLVIDFHGLRETNLLAWLSGGRQRIGIHLAGRSFFQFCFNLPPVIEDKNLHASQMFPKVVDRFNPPVGADTFSVPTLKIPSDAGQWFRETIQPGPLLVLYLDAPVESRTWPAERFAEVGDFMIDRFGVTVVAIAGPQGEPLIQRFLERFLQRTRHSGRVHALFNLSIAKVAAVIGAAQLFVSNDTGPMHLGPALGVPTLGLFSEGLPEHFRPTGPRDGFLRKRPITELGVSEVLEAMEKMWTTSDPDLQH